MTQPLTANVILELQPGIPQPPLTLGQMYKSACASDDQTIVHWREIWLNNMRKNKARFGSFAENGIGTIFGKMDGRPCIIAGAGPSLALNIGKLKNRPKTMGLVSCLHSFHAMEDAEACPDYYVTLDAGPITVEEVTEGGTKTADEYWAITKDRTLVAYIGTHPELLEKWQGKVVFFNAPIPDNVLRDEIEKIEPYYQWISNGGNVLGACMYLAKGWLGSPTTIFIGADFSFSNRDKRRFHAWDSKYDASIGNTLRTSDIYGNSVHTWPSYWNFKLWFDYVTMTLPGFYINASESGIFGAYKEGNIDSVKQFTIDKVFEMFSLHEQLRYQAENPSVHSRLSDIILV